MAPKPKTKPQTIDAYLASLTSDKRAALERVRKIVRHAAPKADECISYGIPAFRLNDMLLVGFGTSASHCAFYPMSASTVAAHRNDLKDYDTGKGTIRFHADTPLPAALLQKLIRARVTENARRRKRSKPQ